MRIITASATEPGEDITNAVRPNFSGHADRAGIELSLKSINHVMYKKKELLLVGTESSHTSSRQRSHALLSVSRGIIFTMFTRKLVDSLCK